MSRAPFSVMHGAHTNYTNRRPRKSSRESPPPIRSVPLLPFDRTILTYSPYECENVRMKYFHVLFIVWSDHKILLFARGVYTQCACARNSWLDNVVSISTRRIRQKGSSPRREIPLSRRLIVKINETAKNAIRSVGRSTSRRVSSRRKAHERDADSRVLIIN